MGEVALWGPQPSPLLLSCETLLQVGVLQRELFAFGESLPRMPFSRWGSALGRSLQVWKPLGRRLSPSAPSPALSVMVLREMVETITTCCLF